MHVTGMTIRDMPPISERITIRFDERVNVLIGPNAVGKSTVLTWMRSEISKPIPSAWLEENLLNKGYDHNNLSVSQDWVDNDWGSVLEDAPPPVITLDSIRERLPKLSEEGRAPIKPGSAGDILSKDFSGSNVKSAIEALREEVWEMEPDRSEPYVSLKGRRWHNYYKYPERRNLLKVNDIVDRCVLRVCDGVIRGSSSQNFVPGPDVRGYLLGPRGAEPIDVHLDMGVDTYDTRNFEHVSPYEAPSASAYPQDADALPIYAADLSSGTQGTLLWIRWLALKMVSHYRFRTDWEEMPAILLIDEIENHLHPTWQRRVIPALLEHFPGLQIFATTHSPFVVAGLKAGQVHLLNRDENGVVTASTNTEDIVGWTADEILRTMMGVDDPTDAETARNAVELRRLRDEGPRADEQEEEKRQSRMQELRRLVDRDLLAGGPMARRREDFAKRFREAMDRRRREEDFNQDNG